MKKVFVVLGICALFMACGNSAREAAETSGPDPNTDTMSVSTGGSTASSVSSDTSNAAAAAPAADAQTTAATTPAAAQPSQGTGEADAVKKGQALYAKLDCSACHKPDVKVVGPAYADVAKKYPNTPANIEYLANKIIKGGSGAWGDIPMTPHPTLSQDDAKALAHYVLSVK